VAIGDVLEERGAETARAIARSDNAAIYTHLDVTREEDWTAAIATAVDRFGGLDVLVNNAGLFLGKGIEEASLDEWQRLCAVNLTGVFLGTKLALPVLRERARHSPHGSVIVNLASVAGLVGSQPDPLYSMTKGGVTLFTKSAALEFARKGYRVRVNSIHPGVTQTDMGDQTFVSGRVTPPPTMSMRPAGSRSQRIRSAGLARQLTLPAASSFSLPTMPRT
jgi:3(or 17)beta-hydroxysteroid dehydrogenase